jgi:cytochrome P450
MMSAPRLDVDFADPDAIEDPFAVYEDVRAAGRVVWNDVADGWMVTGYDDCFAVLGDRHAKRFATVGGRRPEVTFWFDAPNMIIADGAEHQRLRQGVSRHFTLASVTRRWQARVRELVEAHVEPLARDGAADYLGDLTEIPLVIIAEMLGAPADRHDDLRRWSTTVVENVRYGHERPEQRHAMDRAIAELNEYLTCEIERHRREQPDDLLTIISNATSWNEAEIRSSAANLLLAGYDTTARLLGDCLATLQRHPDQRRLATAVPELVPNAIEEVLRWHGTSQTLVREVVGDTVLAGVPLRAGERLYVLLGAANRDPGRWRDPAAFDIRREFKPHLAFGAGPHFCLSAPLVRLEMRIIIETLLRVAPEYRLREIDRCRSFFVRGPESCALAAAA